MGFVPHHGQMGMGMQFPTHGLPVPNPNDGDKNKEDNEEGGDQCWREDLIALENATLLQYGRIWCKEKG